ncbi:MAG TPA: DUF4394 domain-containing protein [Burkholderiaceae bacterium]|nr:DUF4394 domain-containing protein [Burkholderiaceae bacterium]
MSHKRSRITGFIRSVGVSTVAVLAVACFSLPEETEGAPVRETIFAVTGGMSLIKFNAGQPRRILDGKPVTGLAAGDRLIGIDFRVARGVLYALSASGRLYTLDTASGALKPVGAAPAALPFTGSMFGVDFNPAADRIRVVSDSGFNLRLHPDTGAAVDGNAALDGLQPDAALTFAAGDELAGKQPALIAAAYTYNKKDEKITTNYAIERTTGSLVVQGSIEGASPVVSPNAGILRTVGSLGVSGVTDAGFDIADVSGAAYAVLRTASDTRSRLHLIDLSTGRARAVGTVGDGAPLLGMAIEP